MGQKVLLIGAPSLYLKKVMVNFAKTFLKILKKWQKRYLLGEPTHLIFDMVKDADYIHYCTKNQGRGLCVGGDTLVFVKFFGKMTIFCE